MPIKYVCLPGHSSNQAYLEAGDGADQLNPDIAQVFVDVTAGVRERLQKGFLCSTYNGHIHTAEVNG